MPTIINRGKELIRINPTNSMKLEFSITNGRTWLLRYPGNSGIGRFQTLWITVKKSSVQQTKGYTIPQQKEEFGYSVNVNIYLYRFINICWQ